MRLHRTPLPLCASPAGFLALTIGWLSAVAATGVIDAVTLFRKADPAVVVILALDESGRSLRQGSGFIVNGGAAIITNYHVIAAAAAVAVKTSAGDTFPVTTALSIDEETDIAVLRTEVPRPLVTLQLADSSLVKVGEDVAAIGSPQGLENTISTGIVSGLRNLSDKLSYIQMTAPISPGSSGGPLLNANGEVIGITTFLVGGGQNLNFCIPINYAKRMLSRPKPVTLVALARGQGNTSNLLGLWTYDTICHSRQRAQPAQS